MKRETIWVVSTLNVFEFEIETSVRVFKTEEKAREFFNREKEDIYACAKGYFNSIVNFDDEASVGDGVSVSTSNSYEIYQSGKASQWDYAVTIEEKEVF